MDNKGKWIWDEKLEKLILLPPDGTTIEKEISSLPKVYTGLYL